MARRRSFHYGLSTLPSRYVPIHAGIPSCPAPPRRCLTPHTPRTHIHGVPIKALRQRIRAAQREDAATRAGRRFKDAHLGGHPAAPRAARQEPPRGVEAANPRANDRHITVRGGGNVGSRPNGYGGGGRRAQEGGDRGNVAHRHRQRQPRGKQTGSAGAGDDGTGTECDGRDTHSCARPFGGCRPACGTFYSLAVEGARA